MKPTKLKKVMWKTKLWQFNKECFTYCEIIFLMSKSVTCISDLISLISLNSVNKSHSLKWWLLLLFGPSGLSLV